MQSGGNSAIAAAILLGCFLQKRHLGARVLRGYGG
jgi:hypothetical protein